MVAPACAPPPAGSRSPSGDPADLLHGDPGLPGGGVQEVDRAGRDGRCRVRVAGQFDRDQAGVAGVGQGPQHRREVDLAGAELQMFVHVPAHVVDLHVDQMRGHLGDAVGHRQRLQAPAVSDVEGDAEAGRCAERLPQPPPGGDVRHQHARLRFEAEGDAGRVGHIDHLGAAGDEPVPGAGLVHGARAYPGPERDRLGAEVGADRDRPAQELDPQRRVVVQQGRGVLAPRVEQVAGPGLDHQPQVQFGEPVAECRHPGRQRGRERVQVVVVEGQRHPLVAQVGDDPQGVVEPVVGEAVGAVAEPQAGHRRLPRRTGAADRHLAAVLMSRTASGPAGGRAVPPRRPPSRASRRRSGRPGRPGAPAGP